ncbi:MAG TPA: CPBP family intramembrane glutamic endopeptidase [Planktothrix sp.]
MKKHLRIALYATAAACAKLVFLDKQPVNSHTLMPLLLCACMYTLIAEVVLVMVNSRKPGAARPRGWHTMALLAALFTTFCLTGWIGALLKALSPILHFQAGAVVAGVAVGAVWFAVSMRLYKALYPHMQIDSKLPFEIDSPLLVLAVALPAAFLEEVIFRGLLLFTVGALISSVIFAALHVCQNITSIPRSKRQVLGVAVYLTKLLLAGLLYTALVLTFRNLWSAIAAHFTVDMIGLTIMWRQKRLQAAADKSVETN